MNNNMIICPLCNSDNIFIFDDFYEPVKFPPESDDIFICQECGCGWIYGEQEEEKSA